MPKFKIPKADAELYAQAIDAELRLLAALIRPALARITAGRDMLDAYFDERTDAFRDRSRALDEAESRACRAIDRLELLLRQLGQEALDTPAVAELRGLEWSAEIDLEAGGTAPGCPSCGGYQPARWRTEEFAGHLVGHADTCSLAAALKGG